MVNENKKTDYYSIGKMDYRKKTQERMIANIPQSFSVVSRKFSDHEFRPILSNIVRNNETTMIKW